MEIILARHGKPNIQFGAWIAPAQFPDWLAAFNVAGIADEPALPAILSRAASVPTIVCSTLCRSMESARLLAANRAILAEDVFREAELPWVSWRGPSLPASAWMILFRAAWFCGFSAHAESLSKASVRAREAAERLIFLARDSGSAFLAGHGIINLLIARHLLALGFTGPA